MKKPIRKLTCLLVLLVFTTGYAYSGGAQEQTEAKQNEVSILTWDHFVPGYAEQLQKLVDQWSVENNIPVKLDFGAILDITTRLTSEVEAQQGHDIVFLWNWNSALYKESLVDMTDVANELAEEYGPWGEGGKYMNYLSGRWVALPWVNWSAPAHINAEYWRQIGYEPEEVGDLTYDDLYEAAIKLDQIEHPIAFAMNVGDSWQFLYPILWVHGARVVDSDGKVVVNSEETREAVRYVKKVAQYMPSDVFGWDNSGNNKYMLSGKGSWSPNPPSMYPVAVRDDLPVKDDLKILPMPKGPKGRYRVGAFVNIGVMKYSDNIDGAKSLVKYLLEEENMKVQVTSSEGYNLPPLEGYKTSDSWHDDHPELKYYYPPVEEVRIGGWPAPPSENVATMQNLFIVASMFAKAASGESTVDEAVEWAEKEISQLYGQ